LQYLAENFAIDLQFKAEGSASGSITGCSYGGAPATGGAGLLFLGLGLVFARRRFCSSC
jgi:MYXO-CTERM domain-containing protein